MTVLFSALLATLRDDLLIVLSVGIGCVIAAMCLQKRSRFFLRVGISFCAAFAWMVLTSVYSAVNNDSLMLISLLRYMTLFFIFGASVGFWSKANFCQALYAVTVSFSLQNMCERLIEIPRDAISNLPFWLDRLSLALLMGFSLWVYYCVLIKSKRGKSVLDFSGINAAHMLFLGIGVVAVSVVLDIILRHYSEYGNLELKICLHIMSALFSFLTIVVCMSHLRESESERRAVITAQLLYNEQRQYEREKELHDAINIKCHDIRHQIAALGEEGLKDELRRINDLMNIYDTSIRTQNAALDVVLSDKALACTSQNITLTCLADGRRMDFMEDSDIYALFGNILDNAIESAQVMRDPEKRIISLTVSVKGDLLLIECQNFYSNPIIMQDGLPVTTKADRDYHGYGTRSIRLLTEKYGGDLQISTENNIFLLSILLPIPT